MGEWPTQIPKEWKPAPEDELLHTPRGDDSLPWKDTFFFSLRDPKRNTNITMHMTVSANRSPNTRICLAAAQGNNSMLQVCREDGLKDERTIGNSMTHLEVVNLSWDSDHELRWVADTPDLSFDLTVKG